MAKEQVFVDTNIFLRYLTNDNPEIADKIEKVFRNAAKGEIKLITNELVIAEIIWVLESYYGCSKNEVIERVYRIINAKGMTVNGSEMLMEALNVYAENNIDFIDTFNAAFMKKFKLKNIMTLDVKHFSKIKEVSIIKF